MVKAIIQAGFGNQLFQYAMAYAIARAKNDSLMLDTGFFEYYSHHNFGCDARVEQLSLLRLDSHLTRNRPSSYGIRRKFAALRGPRYTLNEGRLWYNIYENPRRCRDFNAAVCQRALNHRNVCLMGFWQNTLYFRDYLEDLRRQFRPNYALSPEVEELREMTATSQSVGIHVRRGDFVRLNWDKGPEYYIAGVEIMKERLNSPRFFVFSDDIDWCRRSLGLDDAVFVDLKTPNKDVDEFFLLSGCRHQLISESTFGWWAAYLNDNPQKIVIIPENAKGQIFDQGWTRI